VQFFWEHHHRIAVEKDEWWTPGFRANLAADGQDEDAQPSVTQETETDDNEAS